MVIQVIGSFNKSTLLIFSSPLPPSDELVAGFLSLRTCQVTFLPVCVRTYTLFFELSLPDAGLSRCSAAEMLFKITSHSRPITAGPPKIGGLFTGCSSTKVIISQLHTTEKWIKRTNGHLARLRRLLLHTKL